MKAPDSKVMNPETGTATRAKLHKIMQEAKSWRIYARTLSREGISGHLAAEQASKLEHEARQIENTLGRDG